MFEPRLKESFKHTPQNLPTDLGKMIQESICQKYTYFNDKDVLVQGAIYPEELILSIGYKEKASLRQLNFECSMSYDANNDQNVIEKFHDSADALDSMINEYIDARGDIEMPDQWTEFDFDDGKVFLRFSKLNTEIEKMTLDFLKEKGEDLSSMEPSSPDLH